ncbi:MAG: IS256 family transposase [Vicinamibacteraceae bacterium]|nr:IS256 family transposase [Vicinamibacteraceae bacterium]
MSEMEIPDELIDQLLGEYRGPEQLTGPDGLISQLRKRLIERAAGAELERHLGYPPGGMPPEAQPNRRNGTTSKTLRTVDGPVTVELPRDRDASFEPRIVPKHGRSFDGFDEQILALYAGGMTTREIQRHLRELYGVDVSDGLVSEVTASIQEDVRAWQGRGLEELYVAVYLDALQVAIRDQQVVRKKAVHVAIGVTLDGERDCLGLWIEKSEGARFWTSVMTELRNRGVKDILFVCTDGLTGFPEAIDAVFPEAVNQTCVVHLVRQSLRYLSWKERKSCAGELRRIYTAPDADQARAVLDELTHAWADSKTKTAALQVWERAWERFIPFLAFPQEIRRVVYTTNTVESLHMQIRKTIKTRGHFPNDDAALRLIWLAIQRAKTNWRACYNWTQAMAVLRIHFGDRIPDNT